MKYLQNLHTHSTFCDGKDTLTEMVEEAISRGFHSIGFSMHSYMSFSDYFNITAEEAVEKGKRYRAEAKRLKALYSDRIDILCGEEAEMYSDVDRTEYDYLIGSVHYVKKDGVYIGFDRDAKRVTEIVNTYFGGDGMAFARAYYENLCELPEHGKYDIVGHFDLVAKLNEGCGFFDENSKEYLSYAFEAIDALKGKIPFMEINTGAVARGYRSVPYPTLPLLKEIKRQGFGILFTSDCHDKNFFDCAFDDAVDLALAAGYKEYFVLRDGAFVPESLLE